MKNTTISQLLSTILVLTISMFAASAQVTAGFSASTTTGCASLRVEFINQSTNSIEWDWNFGDGSAISHDQNPAHYYTTPGTYTVVLTAYGAGASNTETKINYITVNGFSVSVQTTAATCGQSDGGINVTVTGGSAPITYAWNNGATTEDLTGLAAGTYRVSISDASGCQFAESYTVSSSGSITITGTTEPYSPGVHNGSIVLTVSGGTPAYTYSWSNGETGGIVDGLLPGTYCVTVHDANGCASDKCFLIETASAGCTLALSASVTNASCGHENGAVNLTVTGGTTPYTYSWTNGSTDEDLSLLSSGSYRVTVTDAAGCHKSETYLVESSGNITVTGTVQNVVPGVHNGAIELNVTGGTAPYSYSWSNGETGRIIDGLAAGTYCVTVHDANGCTRDKCFLIETAQGGCATLVITGSVHSVTPGTTNGSIEPFVTGGTAPYTYSWSTGSHDRIISGLAVGTYCLTVHDANGCVADHCFVVEFAQSNCSTLTIAGVVTDVSGPGLHDGRINLTIAGGTSPYTYSWSNGATTKNIDGLAPAQYCVFVTDANGCTRDHCFVVEVAQGGCGGFSVTAQITNASCGASNGVINLIVSGGTAPYTYTWSNGSHDEDRNNLLAGNYRVTVVDANGCSFGETYTVGISSNTLIITGTISNVNPAGAMNGSINVTVTGGTAPYTYYWTHGATTEDLSGLEVGTYCLLVTDAHGCSSDKCFNVEGAGTGCGDFSVTGNETSVGCGGTLGAINVTVTFGTPPYSFIWSNGATTEDLTGLSAGSYSLTVEDSGPCRKVRTFTVGYSGGFQITGTVTPSIGGAATGAISITMNGFYAFYWSNGATTQNIDNLAPGQYCVLVTDTTNGCVEDKCFNVGMTGGCGDFSVDAHDDRTLCGPGEVFLEANAHFGTEPYSFSWAPTAGLDNPNNRITVAFVSTTTTFTVTATDDNGCTSTDEVTVFVVNPTGSGAGVTFDSVTICRGDSVQLAAFGGNDYYWDPSNGLSDRNSATPWAAPEESKDYVVIVSNGGCHSTFTVHVEVDGDCVSPGDANHDGIANNNDVLAIGIGNGISGFPRPNATNNWVGQYSPDWFLALASGPNLKHVDCDGSGTIDIADTIPLFLNYGSTHNRSGNPGQKFVDPELFFDLPTDTALAGQELDVPVYLGTNDIQVSNFYGIAFSVNYDNTIVEENSMHFSPVNSFAGNANDLLSFDYDMYGESKMDVALTRLNRVSVGGYGQIGILSFTMKDDISGKDYLVRELALSFSDVRAIDNNENDVLLFYEAGSVFVKQEVSGVSQIKNGTSGILVYPNPASTVINIETDNRVAIREMILVDLVGKEVMKEKGNDGMLSLDIGNLPEGNYLLKVKTVDGEAVRKITVIK